MKTTTHYDYRFTLPSGMELIVPHVEGAEWINGMVNNLTELRAENRAMRKMLDEAAKYAEFSDKIIHGGDGSVCQTWVATILLPVQLKSTATPSEALEAVLKGKPAP